MKHKIKRNPMSEETKRKIGLANSISLKGKKLSKERIEKIRQRMLMDNPMKKKEARLKISQKLTGIIRPRGKLSKCWKGDNVSYFHIHKWLKDNFGKANKCENTTCLHKAKRIEWSLIKGKELKRNRDNFQMLCASCHRKYDFTEEVRKNLSLSHKGQIPWQKKIKANELRAEANNL